MTSPARVEEHPHEPDDDPWWAEWWSFDLVDPDGGWGAGVRLVLLPNQDRCWYRAALARPGQPTLLVRDHGVPHPRHGRLEIRHEGLWADHSCDAPVEQWSLALESFAVALDDPVDAWHGELGVPTPFGFELEWAVPDAGDPDSGGVVVLDRAPGRCLDAFGCEVHGDLIAGTETISVVAVPGTRAHGWGPLSLVHAPGARVMLAPGAGGESAVVAAVGADAVAVDRHPDDSVRAARVTASGRSWFADPSSRAPVIADEVQSRTGGVDRMVCRFESLDGECRVGWLEVDSGV